MKLLLYFEKQKPSSLIILGFVLIAVTGLFDFLSGYEYSFSVFYVLPIALITGAAGQKTGFFVSFLCTVTSLAAEILSGKVYSKWFIPIWNTSIRFSLFVIIVMLLSALKSLLEQERKLAYTDYLTSAVNLRRFRELIQVELYRSHRSQHPLTLAYLDIDDFKGVNDKFGHTAGDEVLCSFVSTIKLCIRKTDFIARIGGDEFAILLPDTNQNAAKVVFMKIKTALQQSHVQQDFPITYSAGVITFIVLPKDSDELIKMTDNLMYSAKFEGKNTVHYFEHGELP